MTTSTLELVDWATILDDEPACEWCDAAATHRLVNKCGCAVTVCHSCMREEIADTERCMVWYEGFECTDCGACITPVYTLSDVLTVVPL